MDALKGDPGVDGTSGSDGMPGSKGEPGSKGDVVTVAASKGSKGLVL